MSLATLSEVLETAMRQQYAVAGFVVLGWEDARAFVDAAEAEGVPVVLQVGPASRAHTPLPVLGAMLGYLADKASVPVVTHLDHGRSLEECRAAIAAGFSSVMYDGSLAPFAVNCEQTARVVEEAHTANVSVEGELGVVGSADGLTSTATSAEEAARFAAETGVDALAISVGNVHYQQKRAAQIDFTALRKIEAMTKIPLVLHGASGIPLETRSFIARQTRVCKLNLGTELRMCFGQALRQALNRDPNRFDRISLLKETEAPMQDLAQQFIRALSKPEP